jgi:hypothetical protein
MEIYPGTLIKDSVSIQLDENSVVSYVNSTRGRTQLEAECTTDIVKAVEDVWGSEATATAPPTIPKLPVNTTPTATEQLRADVDYLSVMTGVTLT